MNINLIVLLLATIGCVCGHREGCHDFDGADTCMQSLLLLGDPDFQFPLNELQMGVHCRSLETIVKCVDDYSVKCFDRFAHQVTGMLVNGVAKTNKGYCSKPSQKTAFISLGNCANSRKQALDLLMSRFIENLQGIDNFGQKHMKIPLLCCNFNEFKSNVLKVSRDETQPKCTEQVVEEIDRLVDGFANDILNLICPKEYSEESSDKCMSIIPLTPEKKSTQMNYKSLLLPLVNIFNSLKE